MNNLKQIIPNPVREAVADLASFPTTDPVNTVRLVVSENAFYQRDGSQPVLVGGGGGGGGVSFDTPTTTSNKLVFSSGTAADAISESEIFYDPVSGQLFFDGDVVLSGNILLNGVIDMESVVRYPGLQNFERRPGSNTTYLYEGSDVFEYVNASTLRSGSHSIQNNFYQVHEQNIFAYKSISGDTTTEYAAGHAEINTGTKNVDNSGLTENVEGGDHNYSATTVFSGGRYQNTYMHQDVAVNTGAFRFTPERPTINGTNFYIPSNGLQPSLVLFNRQILIEGIDYIWNGTEIEFLIATPNVSDIIVFL